ncbi:hypothetical protein WH91_03150 [Devosia psychrophila]|uniref:Uncharacterized protein n=1 Tax=Devosia psychrophila TaxID=728005 RepID=A0ABR5E254_9HYPH|nr:hypothetical protein WH91_03150 [Devosia psychrophila]
MAFARLYAADGIQRCEAHELDANAAMILGGTSFIGGIGSVLGHFGQSANYSGRTYPIGQAGYLEVYHERPIPFGNRSYCLLSGYGVLTAKVVNGGVVIPPLINRV